MEMERTCSINQLIKIDLCGYNVDNRIRKRNLGRLKSGWFVIFKKMTGIW